MRRFFTYRFAAALCLCTCFAAVRAFAFEPLPAGYGSVRLGMTVEETKAALLKEPAFGYRGERDVSLLPGENRTLIETSGTLFLAECWFQFDEGTLSVITINLNKEQIDYYSVFSTLCEKYGEPGTLSPQKSEWTADGVVMTLERPLTLKYTDSAVFEKLQESATVRQSAVEYTRDLFLKSL
ncbi:hypothetical protein [Treponema brennaborense]|uniref:DUF4468 domain-containing protein n=1 Tax=Treponema brennaborense (strain DSM 12168 / CIP 105900 / DD5/3) TaxID=906968 RepID=F4LNP8_TREBD|nr:hypothetical protein [Treponema brennaborense]AEE16883.1 hypothetical protein Trebr_1459 [Treponema brennaborense DSM 12168]